MLELTQAGYFVSLISVGVTLLTYLVRNAVVGKDKMRENKEKMRHHQEKAKEAYKKGDVKAAQAHQAELMKVNMELMKPMLFTFLPLILIFQWMGGAFGDIGSLHNVTVTQSLPAGVAPSSITPSVNGIYVREDNLVKWNWSVIKATESGELRVELSGAEAVEMPKTAVEYTQNGTEHRFESADLDRSALSLNRTLMQTEGNKLKYTILYRNVDSYRVATVFGYDLGWLGWYIVSGLISSMIFNKILGSL